MFQLACIWGSKIMVQQNLVDPMFLPDLFLMPSYLQRPTYKTKSQKGAPPPPRPHLPNGGRLNLMMASITTRMPLHEDKQ